MRAQCPADKQQHVLTSATTICQQAEFTAAPTKWRRIGAVARQTIRSGRSANPRGARSPRRAAGTPARNRHSRQCCKRSSARPRMRSAHAACRTSWQEAPAVRAPQKRACTGPKARRGARPWRPRRRPSRPCPAPGCTPAGAAPVGAGEWPEGIRKQAVHQTFEMLRQALFQEALQDPAPILVPCRLASCCRTSARDLVDDERHVVCLHRADALLNDVVGVGALNRCPNMAVHLRSERQALGLTACVVEGILHEPAAVRVSRELPDVADPRRGWWGAFPRWQLRAGRALQARRAAVQGPRADLKADRSKHL
mmetsp:Transcript_5042/g.14001  ORF Transcript_5042/g.14001 Transcript_5042/m.14001 type:complete len:311 (-) Transcript_5042:51-983(-)